MFLHIICIIAENKKCVKELLDEMYIIKNDWSR